MWGRGGSTPSLWNPKLSRWYISICMCKYSSTWLYCNNLQWQSYCQWNATEISRQYKPAESSIPPVQPQASLYTSKHTFSVEGVKNPCEEYERNIHQKCGTRWSWLRWPSATWSEERATTWCWTNCQSGRDLCQLERRRSIQDNWASLSKSDWYQQTLSQVL